MTSLRCLDASVAAKTLLPEIDSDKAAELVETAGRNGVQLVAPPHFSIEVTSALYKRVQRGELTVAAAVDRSRMLELLPVHLLAPDGLRERALEIAAAANMKWVHDAFYVALAEIEQCELWTADEQLYAAVRAVHPNVRLLSAYDGR